jgi:hypothetical protein
MTHLRACVYLKNTQVNEVAVSTPYMRVIRPYIKRHERCSAAIVFAMAALFRPINACPVFYVPCCTELYPV